MEQPPNKGHRGSEQFLITLGIMFVAVVAIVAGYLSWGHIREVGLKYGEPGANYLPVSVDGMMLAGTVMGAVDNLRGYKIRGWAVVSLWLGSIMTMLFNVASAQERGPIAMGIAAIPAIALIVSVENIFHPSRRALEKVKQVRADFAKVVEHVKNVESAPVTEPVVKPVVKPAPVKKAAPPAGMRGRRPGPQGKPGYRPNPSPQAKQVQGAQPKQTPPAKVELVMPEKTPEPVATETAEISAS